MSEIEENIPDISFSLSVPTLVFKDILFKLLKSFHKHQNNIRTIGVKYNLISIL